MSNRSINKFEGELKLKLFGIEYPMKWNARVYSKFVTETGRDPNSLFADVINELNRLRSISIFELDEEFAASEAMAGLASVVDMQSAAWLFYLAANEKDSVVSFEEIQEAVLLEGISTNKLSPDGEVVKTYPQLFLQFAIFALSLGVNEEEIAAKKNGSLKPSFLERLRLLFSI